MTTTPVLPERPSRSDGGVLNMVGKRGTNDWHFGGMASWEPASTRSSFKNWYYQNGQPDPPLPTGTLYQPRAQNEYWVTTYDAYVGGPLIKDRLFFFASAEMAKREGTSVGAVTSSSPYADYSYHMPKWYAKLDWNINDSNILEVTGASNKQSYDADLYRYDFQNMAPGKFVSHADGTKNGGDLWSGKYTGYLTDSLTLTALYGKMRTTAFQQPVGYDPSLTYVAGITAQNPAIANGRSIDTFTTVVSARPEASWLNRRTLAWQTPVPMLGKMLSTMRPDRSDRENSRRSVPTSVNPGACSPTAGSSPVVWAGVPSSAVVATGFPLGGMAAPSRSQDRLGALGAWVRPARRRA